MKRALLAATLIVISLFYCSPAQAFESSPIGWASQNGGTTGGAGGTIVTVTNATDFGHYARLDGAYIIEVQGNIGDVGQINVHDNKTIIGIGEDPTLYGDIVVAGAHNIIIRNLIIRNDSGSTSNDGVTVNSGGTNVWVDHCEIFNTPDGLCDVTKESDFVTVSWCKFYYTSDWSNTHTHRYACLIGASDDDTTDLGKLHVTFHHNWWGDNCIERMPSVRYGRVHVYNNYYTATGNNYCVRYRIASEVLVQNNYFLGVNDPHVLYISGEEPPGYPQGLCEATGNIYDTTTGTYTSTGSVTPPTYSWTPDDANNVPAIVIAGAGVNKLSGGDLDTTPPTPNPMEWGIEPSAISSFAITMTAASANDVSGVQYFFHCTTTGGHDSGWQDSNSYTDTGLAPSTLYTYQVKARDKSMFMNETAYSSPASATTQVYIDTTPPEPNQMTFAIPPYAVSSSSIAMVATTATDLSGVQYYFACTSGGGHDSGWQDSNSYTDTGLAQNTTYIYTVKARDKSSNHNENSASEPQSATTLSFTCSKAIASDLDNDCEVDFRDYAIMADAWGVVPNPPTLVTNGTFNSDISNWSLVEITGHAGTMTAGWDGTNGQPAGAAIMNKTSGSANTDNHRFYTLVPVTVGTQYRFSGVWKGALHISSTVSSPENRADVFIGFSTNTTPSTWGTLVYRKIFQKVGSSGNLNQDANTFDWEDIRNSPNGTVPTGGVFTATAPYMVIAFNLGGKAGSGPTWVDIDNIKVTIATPCPTIDLNNDCALNFLDMLQFANDWLVCNRVPSSECWQ